MSSSPQQIRPSDDDLNWSATQYVLGELSDSEATAFEERLAHDQVAREAVAASVVLIDALAAARCDANALAPSVSPQRGTLGSPQRTLVVAGLALSLLISALLTANWLRESSVGPVANHDAGSEDPSTVAAANSQGASRLIELWSSSAEAWDDVVSAENHLNRAMDIAVQGHPDPEPSHQSELAVPGWMLAALLETELPETDPASPAIEEN